MAKKAAEALQQLREVGDPTTAYHLALELLAEQRQRDVIDAALRTLEHSDLDDAARPVLRSAFTYYADHPTRDSGALIREKIIRLLVSLGHPDDGDIFLRGIQTYERQPVRDVTQNVRTVALIGLSVVQPALSHLYATRFLSELDDSSPFNSEPIMTAITLLEKHEVIAPIYQFLLVSGLDALEAGHNEIVGKALESLGKDFPVALYADLIEIFAGRDRALVNMGIISHIVDYRVETLYAKLETIITSTRHHELHHYGVVMLAAARDETLKALLFRLVKTSPQRRIENFVEALALLPDEEAQVLRDSLQKRSASRKENNA